MQKRLKQTLNQISYLNKDTKISNVTTQDSLTNDLFQKNTQNQQNINKRENFISLDQSSIFSPEKLKKLLLKRHLHKKQTLQLSQIGAQTGQLKKKRSFQESPDVLSLLKNASFDRLPSLKKPMNKLKQKRMSQTIDPVQKKDVKFPSYFDNLNQHNSNTINIGTNQSIGKAKIHLSKRKFFVQAKQLSTSCSAQKVNQSIKNSKFKDPNPNQYINLGFDEQLKRKYLKSIVDRYFPLQNPNIEQQVRPKRVASFQQSKQSLLNGRVLKQRDDKLPLLRSPRRKSNKLQRFDNKQTQDQSQNQPVPNSNSKLRSGDQSIENTQQIVPSFSQSYVLQKIDQDDQQPQQRRIEDFYSNMSNSSLIGPQTSSQLLMVSSSSLMDVFNQEQSSNLELNQKSQKSHKILQNSSFCVYKIKYSTFLNISQHNDLKTVSTNYEFRKYFLNQTALELKNRELKVREIILNSDINSGLISLWQQDQFSRNCIKMNLSKISPPCSIRTSLPLTLSKLLYKIVPVQQSADLRYLLIKPTADSKSSLFLTQQKLLVNSQYNLLQLIKSISKQLHELQSSVINNKICMNNIFLIDQNRYAINEWGYSYSRQQFLIQDKMFQKRTQPIFKNQNEQWFVTPQYLAPQILQNLLYARDNEAKYWKKVEGNKMELKMVKQNDLFRYGNKSDVWSLGLLVLELITLIPVWVGRKCLVQHRKNPKISPRKGFLYSQKRDFANILTKQAYMKQNLQRIIRIQSQPYILQQWLVSLVQNMLQLDPQKRISFLHIIQILTNKESKLKRK